MTSKSSTFKRAKPPPASLAMRATSELFLSEASQGDDQAGLTGSERRKPDQCAPGRVRRIDETVKEEAMERKPDRLPWFKLARRTIGPRLKWFDWFVIAVVVCASIAIAMSAIAIAIDWVR